MSYASTLIIQYQPQQEFSPRTPLPLLFRLVLPIGLLKICSGLLYGHFPLKQAELLDVARRRPPSNIKSRKKGLLSTTEPLPCLRLREEGRRPGKLCLMAKAVCGWKGGQRPLEFPSIEEVQLVEAKPSVCVGLTRTGGTTAFVLVPLPRPPVEPRSPSDSTPLVARGEIASDSSFSRLKSSLTILVFLP